MSIPYKKKQSKQSEIIRMARKVQDINLKLSKSMRETDKPLKLVESTIKDIVYMYITYKTLLPAKKTKSGWQEIFMINQVVFLVIYFRNKLPNQIKNSNGVKRNVRLNKMISEIIVSKRI